MDIVEGINCETNIDDCVTGPCQNGGTCIDEVAKYTCQCTSDFMGQNCTRVSTLKNQ